MMEGVARRRGEWDTRGCGGRVSTFGRCLGKGPGSWVTTSAMVTNVGPRRGGIYTNERKCPVDNQTQSTQRKGPDPTELVC